MMSINTLDAKIINRGRGPEIAGTRITIYDVMDYLKDGWPRDRIAALFRLASRDIQAAIDYIEQHREEAEAEYQQILDWHHNYRYPPEVQAKVDQCQFAAQRRLEEIRQRRMAEGRNDEDHG